MNLTRILSLLAITFILILPAQAKDMVIKEPPKSLSKYYPPESKELKWIQQMHKMSTHFGGVFVNLKEKDFENVDKHADKLVEEYKKTSEMVPEWEEYFDIKAAEAFAEAAKTHDIAKAGKASGALGKTCGKCHAACRPRRPSTPRRAARARRLRPRAARSLHLSLDPARPRGPRQTGT